MVCFELLVTFAVRNYVKNGSSKLVYDSKEAVDGDGERHLSVVGAGQYGSVLTDSALSRTGIKYALG